MIRNCVYSAVHDTHLCFQYCAWQSCVNGKKSPWQITFHRQTVVHGTAGVAILRIENEIAGRSLFLDPLGNALPHYMLTFSYSVY